MKNCFQFRSPFQIAYTNGNAEIMVDLNTALKPSDTNTKPSVMFPEAEKEKLYTLSSQVIIDEAF